MALTENTEMFVRGERSKTPLLITVGLAVLCAVILLFLFVYTGYTALILAVPVVAVFAAVSRIFYVRSIVEYEYSVMAGVLTVSKIMNQSKRKEIVSIDAKEISEFGVSDKEMMRKDLDSVQGEVKIFDCTGEVPFDSENPNQIYFFKGKDSKYGTVKVYFSPNEKMIDALRLKSPEVMRSVRRI